MGHKFDNIFMLKGSLLNITMYEHFDCENLGEDKKIVTAYINFYNFYPEYKHHGKWISVLNLRIS